MKLCPSFPGYSATELGDVISHRRRGTRVMGSTTGSVSCIDPDYCFVLSQFTEKKGYRTVSITFANGKARPVGVHQLVADAFLGPVPAGMEVRHDNGNPADNRPGNLLYGTTQDNANDRKRHGHYAAGGMHHNAKLSDEQAEIVRQLRAQRVKVKDLASQFGVSVSTIEGVIYGKTFRRITS